MNKATIKLPKVEARNVWIGCYGGHYGVVMVFSKKPELQDDFRGGKCYPIDDPNLVATVGMGDWESWFGMEILQQCGLLQSDDYLRPLDTECRKVVQVELTAPWDEHGNLIGMNTTVDR